MRNSEHAWRTIPEIFRVQHRRCFATKATRAQPGPIRKRRAFAKIEEIARPLQVKDDGLKHRIERIDDVLGPRLFKERKWLIPTIADPEVMSQIVDVANLQRYQGQTIIEMNSGPGFLAEKIIEKVKPAHYIALEPRDRFSEELQRIQDNNNDGASGTTFDVIAADGYDWATLSNLESSGLLNFEKLSHPRNELNPRLVFIATPDADQLEQLVNQWLGTLGTASWIQKYGRVCMYIFVTQPVRQKLMAGPASPLRSRITVVREGNCDIREILHTPFVRDMSRKDNHKMLWIEDFADLPSSKDAIRGTPDMFFPISSLSLLEIKPHEHSAITAPLGTYDFIAKTLLSNKSTPLYQQIRGIASGAFAILRELSPELVRKWPQDMTVAEINQIALAFDAWPFKPKYLHNESFDDIRGAKEMRNAIRSQSKSYKPTFSARELQSPLLRPS